MKKLLALVLALVLVLSAAVTVNAEEELTTVTLLGYNQGSGRMGYFKDSYAYQWVMDKIHELGIDLQMEYLEADQYQTAIQTRLSSGQDLADMMFLEIDTVTLNNLIEKGMLTSVDEILEYSDGTAASFLAPDGEYSILRSSGTAPDGKFWVLQGIGTGEFDINDYDETFTVAIRQDWLDKLGLDMPTDINEFRDTLIAFREQDANGDGINNEKALFATDLSLLKHSGIAGWFGLIMNNIGLDPNTNEVTTVFYQDGFKPYVEYVQSLVDAGVLSLADKASMYTTDTIGQIGTDTIGATYYKADLLDVRDGESGNPDCKYTSVILQGVDDIVPTVRGSYSLGVNTGYYAFMNTVDKEAAAKLLDFFFSEGYFINNLYGVEGHDWEYDEKGNIVSLISSMSNDEIIAAHLGDARFYMDRANLPILEITRTYYKFDGEKVGSFASCEDLVNSKYGQAKIAAAEATDKWGDGRQVERLLTSWSQLDQKNCSLYQTNLSACTALPTNEEVEILAKYESELTTAMNELFVDLTRGDKDLDKLDEYLDDLRAMGLDEVIGVYQARYERFCGK